MSVDPRLGLLRSLTNSADSLPCLNGMKRLDHGRDVVFSRVHCFHCLIPLAKQGNYAIVANVESMDYDPLVVKLNKDISAIEEAMGASLQQHKFQYIFEGQCWPPAVEG